MIGRRSAPSEIEQNEPTSGPKGFDDFELRLGDIMRGERATLGKSLLDVQRELKIKATYIAAIENSDPTAFETPGFVAGYVRSYARYLGLDPEWAYKSFCEEGNFSVSHGMSAAASGPKSGKADRVIAGGLKGDPFEQPNLPFIPSNDGLFSRVEPGAMGSVAVLLALIGFIGYGGYAVLQEVQRVEFAPVDQAPGVTAQVDPLAPSDSLSIDVTSDAQIAAVPAPDRLDRLYRPQALEVPVLTARDAPIATLDPTSIGTVVEQGNTSGISARRVAEASSFPSLDAPVPGQDALPVAGTLTAEAATDAEETPPVQVVADDAAEVVMFAVRPSWVRVKAVDGTVLFEKILDPGERYVLPKSEEPPLLRTGNAGSVYFSVAGQTYGPVGEGPSIVKDVALGPKDVMDRFQVADLGSDRDLARIVAEAEALQPETPSQ